MVIEQEYADPLLARGCVHLAASSYLLLLAEAGALPLTTGRYQLTLAGPGHRVWGPWSRLQQANGIHSCS